MDNRSLPSAVVIDFDDTLYAYQPCHEKAMVGAIEYLSAETGVPKKIIENELKSANSAVKSRLGAVASSHSRILYAQEALSSLGFSSKPVLALGFEQIYWSTFLNFMKPNVGVEEFLSAVRYQQIPIVLLTDLTSQIQIRKLQHMKWDLFFDFVLTSELIGSEKETGAPFEFTLELLKEEERTNVWFIGDKFHDVPDIPRLIANKQLVNGRGFLKDLDDPTKHYVSSFKTFSELVGYVTPRSA
jgi:FMN phosphatase YigB (HAD superfamily)